MSANHNAVNEYRNLPISVLVESATNPRRRFNEETCGSLQRAFRAKAFSRRFWCASWRKANTRSSPGARRLRAAKLAALETVPVRVVALSDAAGHRSPVH